MCSVLRSHCQVFALGCVLPSAALWPPCQAPRSLPAPLRLLSHGLCPGRSGRTQLTGPLAGRVVYQDEIFTGDLEPVTFTKEVDVPPYSSEKLRDQFVSEPKSRTLTEGPPPPRQEDVQKAAL